MRILKLLPFVILLILFVNFGPTAAQEFRPPKSLMPAAGLSGTYAGRLYNEQLHHRFIQGIKEFRRVRGDRREILHISEDRDDSGIAIIEDDGSVVANPSPFDLVGLTLRFEPDAPSGFNVSSRRTTVDQDMGNPVLLGDDDSTKVSFGSGFTFRFFGATYGEMYVNSNGNLTFGRGDKDGGIDIGIYGRELSDFLTGPPRIAGFFADLVPAGSSGIYVKALADRVVITWNRLYLYNSNLLNTFQIILFANGAIELAYSDTLQAQQGVVGISPGGSTGALSAVDFSRAPISGLNGSIVERFNTKMEVDLQALSQKFYKSHPDSYEFLAAFSNFDFNMGDFRSFEINVSNSILGLGGILNNAPGQQIFNECALFGSSGKLESFIMLGPLAKYPADPEQVAFGTYSTVNVIGQEAGHRWGAFVRARINGVRSDLLLEGGVAPAHWSFFHDTNASDLQGNKIRDNKNGTFTTTESARRYSQLDQYLMGLRDSSEVEPFFFVDQPTGTTQKRNDPPAVGITFSGIRRNVTVQDIIAEEGVRTPAPATSPKVFRMAFVLLVRRGTQPAAAEIDKIKTLRTAWEKHFQQATENRGFMDTRLAYTERPLISYLPLAEGDAQRFTGIALANRASYPVTAKCSFYGDNGQLMQAAGIVNPVSIALGPGQQKALLDAQIFNLGITETRQGWIKVESSSDQLVTFFMIGDTVQTYLDGGLSQQQPLTQLLFSRTLEGPAVLFGQATTTEISLVNPNSAAANPQLTLYDSAGRVTATATVAIPPNGRLHKTLAQIFAALPLPVSAGYLEVQSSQPLLGFEWIRFGQSAYGLPAQASNPSSKLYSAQFASGGAGVYPVPFFTDLNLVNNSTNTASVTIRVVGEDGNLLQVAGAANPLVRTIASKATLTGRADRLFGFPSDNTDRTARVGSLVIEVSGGTVLGDVVFGDAAAGKIVTALPLQYTLLSDVIFAQLAEGQSGNPPVDYFTGIAVLNPNSGPVQLTLDVYRETGDLAGTGSLSLPAGTRFSRLVREIVPAAAGQMRGYIRLRSAGGSIALFELFGDSGLARFLAAVPPQNIVSTP